MTRNDFQWCDLKLKEVYLIFRESLSNRTTENLKRTIYGGLLMGLSCQKKGKNLFVEKVSFFVLGMDFCTLMTASKKLCHQFYTRHRSSKFIPFAPFGVNEFNSIPKVDNLNDV